MRENEKEKERKMGSGLDARQDKTRQDKTKQSRVDQIRSEQSRA
jgi:hypothetical protein